MSGRARLVLCVAVLMPLTAMAESSSERQAWREEIAAARARAEQHRAALRAEFERNKVERTRLSRDIERDRRASDQVLNDFSLQRGDIVSTVDGLFVFDGDGEGSPSRRNFTPLAPAVSTPGK